jgi:major structural subunit of bundle-forming pilus
MIRFSQLRKTSRRGFNLIEAAIVLGVIGLVIGGIWVAAAAVQANLRKSDASKGLIQIIQNTRNLYYGQSPTGTTDVTVTTELINARAIPGDFISGTTARNPFNGAVTVVIDPANAEIDVSYAAVPRDACIDLTSKNTNISSGMGLTRLIIDATGGGTDTTITTFPYLPTAAATNCGDSNLVTWSFGLRG